VQSRIMDVETRFEVGAGARENDEGGD
jgi:hypothetical protein